jgi:hypothetical protein
VALVVGGVVEEDAGGAVGAGGLVHRGLERRRVGDVAAEEENLGPGARGDLGGEGAGVLDVDEGHAGALGGEALDQRGADAAAAAGDEDRGAGEVRVARAVHVPLPFAVRAHCGGRAGKGKGRTISPGDGPAHHHGG